MSDSPLGFLREVREAIGNALKVIESAGQTAQKIAKMGFSAIFGALGGFIGLLLGYAVYSYHPDLDFVYLSFVLFGTGFLIGVAAFMGPSAFGHDRRRRQREAEAGELLAQIRNLPRNAPQTTRAGLWARYDALYDLRAPPLLPPPDIDPDEGQ